MTGQVNATCKEQAKTTFNANAGVQFGFKGYSDQQALMIFGPRGEVRAERNGTYMQAGLGVGTSFTADLKAGREIDINKTLGLDLSANVSNTTSLLDKNYSTHSYDFPTGKESDIKSFRTNITQAGAKAMLNIKPHKDVKIGFGASGQYVKHSSMDHTSTRTYNGTTYSTNTSSKSEGFIVSPEIALDMKMGKHVGLGLEANSLGGNVKVVYNF